MIRLTYPNKEERKPIDIEYIFAQVMWYTIMPCLYTYIALKLHPLLFLLIIPNIILRIRK